MAGRVNNSFEFGLGWVMFGFGTLLVGTVYLSLVGAPIALTGAIVAGGQLGMAPATPVRPRFRRSTAWFMVGVWGPLAAAAIGSAVLAVVAHVIVGVGLPFSDDTRDLFTIVAIAAAPTVGMLCGPTAWAGIVMARGHRPAPWMIMLGLSPAFIGLVIGVGALGLLASEGGDWKRVSIGVGASSWSLAAWWSIRRGWRVVRASEPPRPDRSGARDTRSGHGVVQADSAELQ